MAGVCLLLLWTSNSSSQIWAVLAVGQRFLRKNVRPVAIATMGGENKRHFLNPGARANVWRNSLFSADLRGENAAPVDAFAHDSRLEWKSCQEYAAKPLLDRGLRFSADDRRLICRRFPRRTHPSQGPGIKRPKVRNMRDSRLLRAWLLRRRNSTGWETRPTKPAIRSHDCSF